ncbi:YfiR family protein [Massilia scottii]|uniref:YfiR family protein n=1 Tax=Massilia scottii TaxID=3057166 RepID=UPI0027967A1C|nr:YfiR family protein [Massilia sp. CCM 9029]MDQ1833033.1 YfiR family protein [Massilia sp. CCM 9029]
MPGRESPPPRRALLRGAAACFLLALLALLAPLAVPGLSGAQAALPAGGAASLERSIKAAFLYKFLGYAEFPASAFADGAAPLVIGVTGADDLAADLARIVAGRVVQGRPVAVRTLRDQDAPAGVHLLFVGGDDPVRLRNALRAIGAGPTLVVTESQQGLQQGSVINFRIVGERVRFDVSLEAADRNSVKLSSRLLTVANHVHKGAP